MVKQRFTVFLFRWLFNSLGLWIAANLLGTGYADRIDTAGISGFLLAGFIFSIVNAVLKPMLVILALPAILLSLGLFMLVVNGVMVYISLKLTAPAGLTMSFVNSVLAGIILSLINYMVSTFVELRRPYNYRRR